MPAGRPDRHPQLLCCTARNSSQRPIQVEDTLTSTSMWWWQSAQFTTFIIDNNSSALLSGLVVHFCRKCFKDNDSGFSARSFTITIVLTCLPNHACPKQVFCCCTAHPVRHTLRTLTLVPFSSIAQSKCNKAIVPIFNHMSLASCFIAVHMRVSCYSMALNWHRPSHFLLLVHSSSAVCFSRHARRAVCASTSVCPVLMSLRENALLQRS